ncbi:MAG TPA: SusC/RagA family TonB-linked outer membrane protein [Gemmatimonadaceae bacterium]|nr:SusC/RagA family TonB-linked outer membrane protein [Gemmatimonadaceae bacterium]
MRTLLSSLTVLLAVLAVAPRAQAQGRTVTGQVTAAEGGQPVTGAIITAVGHPGIVSQTDEQGKFRVSLPAGAITLVVRTIGYKRQEIAVPASQSSVQVRLARDVLKLQGMIVTGQATSVARQNIATAVSVVQSADLTRVPAQSLTNALQGKVPGAHITMNSGAPGGGGQIQIRGVTSILGSGEPLFVLDGVIISNATIEGGMNSLTAASGGGISSSEDNAANRLADLNPNDIASVEVLKGAAASAIYGEKATNGVILITTKRGVSGRPRFNITQRLGVNTPEHLLGSRHFSSTQELVDTYVPPLDPGATASDSAKYNAAVAMYTNAYQAPYFDYQKALYGQRDLSYETDVSVSGGTDNTKYFVSGTIKRDAGTELGTGATRQNLRVNLDQSFGDRVTAHVSTAFIRDVTDRGISNNNNNNASPLYVLAYTPAVINLAARDSSGSYPENPFAGGGSNSSNPFQTLAYIKNNSDVYRWIGGGRLDVQAITSDHNSLTLSAIGGVDWFNQDDELYSPSFLQFEPADGYLGTAVQGNADNRQLNASLNAVWKYSPSQSGILGFLNTATTSTGLQYEETGVNRYNLRARGLVPGVGNIDQGTRDQSQTREAVRDQAYYGQEELLAFNSRLFLTGGFRAERSSVNGDRKKFYIFPKASGSYRFVNPFPGVDEVKLRAGIGTSGNQPRYGDRDQTLALAGQIDGENALTASSTLGNPHIKPEKMTEKEFGMDASFLDQRVAFEGTRFDRTITDLLLTAPLAPSSGLGQEVINGGEITSKGWELALTLSPFRGNFSWGSHTSFYHVQGEVVSLPVPAFTVPSSGFGAAYGRSRIAPGYSTTAIWGNITHPDGTFADTVIGDATPKFTMQFSNIFTWKALSLETLFDWRHGGVVSDLDNNLWDEGKNSWDYDHKAPNGDPRPLGEYRYETWDGGHNALVYVQDGSFVKLRELTLSYAVPQSIVDRLPGNIQALQVSLTGRNLHTWTSYWGIDPEVSNFGNQTVSHIVDLAPYPVNRSYFLSLNVRF